MSVAQGSVQTTWGGPLVSTSGKIVGGRGAPSRLFTGTRISVAATLDPH